jgi:hypothetical protein
MTNRPLRTVVSVIFVAAVVLVICWQLFRPPGKSLVASLSLADGRIINIEGVAFGTNLTIGNRSIVVDNLGRWLSPRWRQFFQPRFPQSQITLDRPGLIVWLDAIDPLTRSNVDCQRLRVELIDDAGDRFESSPNWGGFPNFWRSGHVFNVFPRDARKLTLQITPWRTNVPVRLDFANPAVTVAALWTGSPLPQTNRIGDMEISLTGLALSTNGDPTKYWSTPVAYWKPIYEIRSQGSPAIGWGEPEWQAEDAVGNRGKYLGVHRSVLRFSATVYPLATDQEAAVMLGSLPEFNPAAVTNNVIWNRETPSPSNSIVALGCFPPGTRVFFEGAYLTNPPAVARMSATRGGAPSGWVGTVQRISSYQTREWRALYDCRPGHLSSAPAR